MSRLARAAACWLLALAVAPSLAASPSIIVTVDVETTTDLPLTQQIDAVCTDGVPCGLTRIASMLKARGFRGTFFLDVYEHRLVGEATLKKIALDLQAQGHDVALHTHPQWVYDASQPYMYAYGLEEQQRIIAEGKRLLEEWTGLPVVAHRAGAYSANSDTLEALRRNGIFLDSSLFLDHADSHLNGLGLPSNLPSSVHGVTEIPVTVYERQERPAFLPSFLPPFRSVRKIDADWFVDEKEASAALNAVVAADLPYITLFLHSFSLISGLSPDGKPIDDVLTQRVLETMLDGIQKQHLEVVTMRELAARTDLLQQHATDIVPGVVVQAPLYRYAAHMLIEHWILAIVAGGLTLLIVAVSGVLWFVRPPVPRSSTAGGSAI